MRRAILAATVAAVLAASASARASAPPLLDPASLADARTGLEHLYHARTGEAAAAFERIRARHPDSPAADFLLGGISWHELTTGAQGFSGDGPEEATFFARMDAAIAAGERAVAAEPGDVSARFFLGGAYGYEARYLALQERWWDAYRTGRKGLKHLERVARDAPGIDDTYLGLGIYHYYADVIPGVLKLFAGLVGLGGDRERGLEEIRRALRGGVLVRSEAAFFLAEIETTFEEDHWTALGYARALRDGYPENELFTWLHARVLDELYLTDRAGAEWRTLRAAPRTGRVRGFLDYRLARTRLGGGDFAGGARELEDLLARGRLGSRRITMWGRLRFGLALDYLGRHEEAMTQYRLARDLDASDPAKDRASARLAAGARDPAVTSLEELAEMARIVRSSRTLGDDAIRRVETLATRPSRGLAGSESLRYFRILADLAVARLVRGDAPGAEAAVTAALEGRPPPSRESRAELLAVRARARARRGRIDEADADLRESRSLSAGGTRERRAAERELLRSPPPPTPPVAGEGAAAVRFEVPDRGELAVEVEGDFLPAGRRLRLALRHGVWTGEARFAVPTAVRYRIVADGGTIRTDPAAARVILVGDEAWCESGVGTADADQPKQTNSSPSR